MRLLILVFLVALASANGVQAATPINGPVALVTALYRTYAWEAVIAQPDLSSFELFEQPRNVLAQYFDGHLVELILQDRECAKSTHEVCRLDFMPLWSGQDPGATDLAIRQTGKAAIVSVQFRYPGNGELVKLTYQLSQTAAGWRISDIRGASFSLLSVLGSKR
ncbi:MAG: hypothetical protein ABI389_01740 [Rhodanobacter sp.]